MQKIVVNKLLKKLTKPTDDSRVKLGSVTNVCDIVIQLFASAIKRNDCAMLTMLGSQLQDNLTDFYSATLYPHEHASKVMKLVHSPLVGKTINYVNSKKVKEPLAISDEHHAAIRLGMPELNDLDYACHLAKNNWAIGAKNINDYYTNSCNDKDYFHMVMLCNGLIPTDDNPNFSFGDISETVKGHIWVDFMHSFETFSVFDNKGASINSLYVLNNANTSQSSTPKPLHYNGMRYLSQHYLKIMTKDGGPFKRADIINEIAKKKPLSSYVFSDHDVCLKWLTGSNNLGETVERFLALVNCSRNMLVDGDDGITKTDKQINNDAVGFMCKLQEDVIFTRAAAKHIDRLCAALSRNVDEALDKYPAHTITRPLSRFFDSSPTTVNMRSGINVIIGKCIVDLELDGVSSLAAKLYLHSTSTKDIDAVEQLDKAMASMPFGMIKNLVLKGGLPAERIYQTINTLSWLDHSFHYKQHPYFAIPACAKLLAAVEQEYPRLLERSSRPGSIKNILKNIDDVSPATNAVALFDAQFAMTYYNNFDAITGAEHARANVDFLTNERH